MHLERKSRNRRGGPHALRRRELQLANVARPNPTSLCQLAPVLRLCQFKLLDVLVVKAAQPGEQRRQRDRLHHRLAGARDDDLARQGKFRI